ncbi:hypothetical protein GJW-30_1_02417 [Variibacter gotjawalensis]|uniref:Uncharacterized protein n=1 Tax=Variibacter gotjawalensis TaxID=1333996 RepID=A0A0S3PV96_9BRAD|nr:hypothetical protein [Variibacter gotjawalensis]NIK45704.1 hypothetical protein [Variibacter gotjawalensis]RZS47630.1 hypothetical protein EV661_0020 [Variibacter gotjawalensis]BAT59882.1 hypothetical protein GJW-30_1_02417 [Variibacter gotjawalensis]
MSETATPTPAATSPKQSRLMRWLGVITSVIFLLLAIVKVSEFFLLPSCDSSRSTGAIKSIFKDKNIGDPTLTNTRATTGAAGENTCIADYALPNEKGELTYRVYWESWSPKVMITKADTK